MALAAAGCEGPRGDAGTAGGDGNQGPAGPAGPGGPAGPPGSGICTEFQLPGETFFPEGIALAGNGDLFVGSLTSGDIVAFEAAGDNPERAVFLDLGDDDIAGGVVGLLLVEDADERTFVACDSDVSNPKASTVVRIDVSDLSQPTPVLTSHALEPSVADGNVFCNDIAVDSAGSLYATDSFGGQILIIPDDAEDEAAATLWKADPALAGTARNPFGANGIVVLSDGTDEFVFVVNYALGTLHRIAIDPADGSAGDLVPVALTNGAGDTVTLSGPDGIKAFDDDNLIVVENGANKLSKITLGDAFGATPTGKITVLSSRLDVPTTVAIDGDSALVVEGQLDHLLNPSLGSAALPFCVSRVQVY